MSNNGFGNFGAGGNGGFGNGGYGSGGSGNFGNGGYGAGRSGGFGNGGYGAGGSGGFGNGGYGAGGNGGFGNGGYGAGGNGGFGNGGYGAGGNGGFGNGGYGAGGNGSYGTGFDDGSKNKKKENVKEAKKRAGFKTKKYFTKKTLIFSILAAVLFFFIGEVIYSNLIVGMSSVVFMGAYFAIFGAILSGVLFITGILDDQIIGLKNFIVMGISLIALFGCGMLFEFLYEINPKAVVSADQYVFIIDNSGSMLTNDPNQLRVKAVNDILDDQSKDVKYAVYSFGHDVRCIRPLAPRSEGNNDFTVETDVYALTPLIEALTLVKTDMESGVLSYSKDTQVVLLADGLANDAYLDINIPLNFFAANGIKVSTVGLGDADTDMLTKIANTTGGKYMGTSDVNQLSNAMMSVIDGVTLRNLISEREPLPINWPYVIMRIIFITLLGCIFLGIKLAMVNNSDSTKLLIISSIIGSLLAGILMEVGIGAIGLPANIMRLFMTILIAFTPAFAEKFIKGQGNDLVFGGPAQMGRVNGNY